MLEETVMDPQPYCSHNQPNQQQYAGNCIAQESQAPLAIPFHLALVICLVVLCLFAVPCLAVPLVLDRRLHAEIRNINAQFVFQRYWNQMEKARLEG